MAPYKHSYASFGSCHHSPPTDRGQLQSYKKPSLEPLRNISIGSTGPLSNSLSVDLRLQGFVYVFSHLTQSYQLLLLSAKPTPLTVPSQHRKWGKPTSCCINDTTLHLEDCLLCSNKTSRQSLLGPHHLLGIPTASATVWDLHIRILWHNTFGEESFGRQLTSIWPRLQGTAA